MQSGSKERIARSAGRISGATLISRILGLVRDSVFAAFFGTTYFGDAFNVAFLIPNFLRRVLGEGTLHASYVPVYTQALHKEGEKSAIDLASKVFSVLVVVLGLVTLLGIIFAGPIVRTYAFGWKNSPETFSLTVKLTRILFPYLFFVSLSALAGGTLNCRGYFGLPALAPAFLNISLIATAFTFMRMGPASGESMITRFSIGALVGGVLQIAVQVPRLLRTGHRVRFDPDFKDPGVKWVARLMLPGILAFAVTQINVLVDTLLATTLAEGSVTALRLGNRIAIQPLGVFGVAITTAVLPTLAAHAAKEDRAKLVEDFAFSERLILAFLIPSGIALMVLATPVIRLLFERGEFTAERSTPMTAQALFYYTIGLFSYGGMKAVVQAFYSMKDTVTPMKVAILNVGLNITLNLILVRYLGLIGLALATSISSIVGFAILSVMLNRRLGDIRGKEIWTAVGRILVASLAMGGVLYVVSARFDAGAVNIWGKLLQVAISGAAGLATFIGLSLVLKVKEITFILGMVFRRRGR
ncbi:MAG: murein biosynthesis integral membrane protein MurJ [Candidatus Eisenbacteria bacterium]